MNTFTLFCFLLFGFGSFCVGTCIDHWRHARKGDFKPGRHNYPTRKTPAFFRFGVHTEESYATYSDPSQSLMLVSKKNKQVASMTIGQYLDDHPEIKTIRFTDSRLELQANNLPQPKAGLE